MHWHTEWLKGFAGLVTLSAIFKAVYDGATNKSFLATFKKSWGQLLPILRRGRTTWIMLALGFCSLIPLGCGSFSVQTDVSRDLTIEEKLGFGSFKKVRDKRVNGSKRFLLWIGLAKTKSYRLLNPNLPEKEFPLGFADRKKVKMPLDFISGVVLLKRLERDEGPDAAQLANDRGLVLMSQGELEKAQASHEEALQLRRRLYGDEHGDPEAGREAARISLRGGRDRPPGCSARIAGWWRAASRSSAPS